MIRAYVITGKPGAGKTTVLKNIALTLGNCGGFYTTTLLANSKKQGYKIVTLDGRSGMLAHVSYHRNRVQGCGVTLDTLDSIGLLSLYKALAINRCIILDEIGPMHLVSKRFQEAIVHILEKDVPLIATAGSHLWTDEMLLRSDVQVFHLTPNNREEIAHTICDLVQGRNNHGRVCE